MKIEIDSKRNNPLLNRTEIYFTINHEGEGTPNREIIRSELADKLNVKKENIIVNTIQSSFGIQEISGYAKVYSSQSKSKDFERDYILRRNKLIEPKEKEIKKAEEKPAPPEPKGEDAKDITTEEKPVESGGEIKEETPAEHLPSEQEPTGESPKQDTSEPEKPEEKPPEAAEPPKEEGSKVESAEEPVKKPEEKPKEETTSEESEQPAEEKKE